MQRLGPVPTELLEPIIGWIDAIPLEQWPQQHRIDEQLRPAMVNDLTWHGFGAQTDALAAHLQCRGARLLSVVMPGHTIPPHTDAVGPRVHVPLLTNPYALMYVAGEGEVHMGRGFAWRIDPRVEHMVANGGDSPRLHLILDVE